MEGGGVTDSEEPNRVGDEKAGKKKSLWQRSLRVLFLVGREKQSRGLETHTHTRFTFTQMDKHPRLSWKQKPLRATYSHLKSLKPAGLPSRGPPRFSSPLHLRVSHKKLNAINLPDKNL